ncbi:MAG: hypothetical protein E7188_07615 [Erysipelotrichaceae bacterium]|nr:hypothetical protein [Erysipelotrichaceae bacterium]
MARIKAISSIKNSVKKAQDVVVDTVEKVKEKQDSIKEKQNLNKLKKDLNNHGNILLITREVELGEGIYTIKDIDGNTKYNTLLIRPDSSAFEFQFYAKNEGRIGSIVRVSSVQKGLLFSKEVVTDYLLKMSNQFIGTIIRRTDSKGSIYITDFNDWMATGNFTDGNYKVFDSTTGKTIVSVTKTSQKSTKFAIDYEELDNESMIVILTVFIDYMQSRRN